MSIDVWAYVAFFTHFNCIWTRCGRCENIGTDCHVIGTGCILGRASSTMETLPDFREWCRVTRHPRVFCGLTGPLGNGVSQYMLG